MQYTESEHKRREIIIEEIEKRAGTLTTVPYHLISTKDLEQLYTALAMAD
jgi:hypothetical protein